MTKETQEKIKIVIEIPKNAASFFICYNAYNNYNFEMGVITLDSELTKKGRKEYSDLIKNKDKK